MNDTKTCKSISNVFKLGETPFKQVCDGQADVPTDPLTIQKWSKEVYEYLKNIQKRSKRLLSCFLWQKEKKNLKIRLILI